MSEVSPKTPLAVGAVRATSRPAVRALLVAAGTLAVALGTLGLFLPVLPTTPFLLLAAFCYARSSRRFYDGLLNNRWFGEYIRNYREGRGVTVLHKTIALVLLWGTIGYSALFAVRIFWVRILLVGIAVGVTLHLLMIKTCRTRSKVSPGQR